MNPKGLSPNFAFPVALILAATSSVAYAAHRSPDETLALWPGTPPGVSRASGPEKILEGRPRPFFQLTDISVPKLEVYRAPDEKRNGTSILVCPGGGMQRLAYEHEGLEVVDWLNSLGITACVLKYRVPAPSFTGLIDAQRAMGLIRSNAERWRIDSSALGFIGFSAGGEIGAWLITHPHGREYDQIDAADQQSCRPDFAGLIYPGGLFQRGGTIKDGIATNINSSLPPVFMAQAFDDFVQDSLTLGLALKRARVPTEIHIYHEGAHGFGVRETGLPVSDWKNRFVAWLDALTFLDPPKVRRLAASTAIALQAGEAPPKFTDAMPEGTLADAYLVQRRIVNRRKENDRVSGYKGAGASVAAQKALGIDAPLTGVLFRGGQLAGDAGPIAVERAAGEHIAVETEIGYVMGVDFSFAVPTDAHAKDAVAAIVPVIELPRTYDSGTTTPDARNLVAENIGSARYIVGKKIAPGEVDPNTWQISLQRDGSILHETTGGTVNGGQWHNLRSIINQVTGEGHVLRAGDIIICGALGKVEAGEPGKYTAKYGDAQAITFEVK